MNEMQAMMPPPLDSASPPPPPDPSETQLAGVLTTLILDLGIFVVLFVYVMFRRPTPATEQRAQNTGAQSTDIVPGRVAQDPYASSHVPETAALMSHTSSATLRESAYGDKGAPHVHLTHSS